MNVFRNSIFPLDMYSRDEHGPVLCALEIMIEGKQIRNKIIYVYMLDAHAGWMVHLYMFNMKQPPNCIGKFYIPVWIVVV